MKRLMFLTVMILVVGISSHAQERRFALYGVAFYNLENLFDTIHNEGKNDYEYLPEGRNKWNTMKYMAKLKNMSQVLSELATDKIPAGAAVIGVSEIEDRLVLEDLLKQPALADRGYEIEHYEGPDRRGVDCALFYNPRFFQVDSSKLVPYVYPNNDTTHVTRGFLVVSGRMADEHVHFIVNHWPSRAAASEARERASVQVKAIKESLVQNDPSCKVIIMGDMNDDPMDKSMRVALGAKRKMSEVGPHDLYNPWWDMLEKKGMGSLCYRGKWNLFDQIVFTGNLLNEDRKTLSFWKNEIFMRDYLFQQEGKYKGYPKRTHAGGVWLNGYSDHLPTLIYLIKEVQ